MVSAITASGLTKFYGDAPGIIDLDLDIAVGEVFGFLGPNGAGKSTTIRTLLNFLYATGGSATVLGLDIETDTVEIRRRTGYLPGDLALYETMTAREFLLYFSNLRKVDTRANVSQLADRFELDLDRRISDYSTGNRQKVGLVNAFMHEPELLILDEPTAGLDPLMQQEFQHLINETRAAGRTVFLSSHILSEVDRVADRVGIVRESRLIAVDTVEAFKAAAQATISLRFTEAVDPQAFESLDDVTSVSQRNDGHVLVVTISGSVDPVIKKAAEYQVESVSTRDDELEEVFLTYYEGDVPTVASAEGIGDAP
jgi:ABC-2 type transport system ATP-binding protein